MVESPYSPRDSQESPTPQFKASNLWHLAFFIVQLSHPYMTTGITIALTRRTFVSKVMSLLFNMLSRLVIAFLPRSKCLLISCLQVTLFNNNYCNRESCPGGSVVKDPPASEGDIRDGGSIPGSGRSPGAGDGHPLQYSCLGNPMDRGTG